MNGYFRVKAFLVSDDVRLTRLLRSRAKLGLYGSLVATAFGRKSVRIASLLVAVAPASRAPKTLRVLGAVMCLQALTAALARPERARAILEWEVMRGTAALRVGAAAALVAGSFVAFAVTGRRPSARSKTSDRPGDESKSGHRNVFTC